MAYCSCGEFSGKELYCEKCKQDFKGRTNLRLNKKECEKMENGCIKCGTEMRTEPIKSGLRTNAFVCMNEKCERYGLLSIVRFKE